MVPERLCTRGTGSYNQGRMKHTKAYLILLLASTAPAATIDVTSAPSVQVNTGDTLSFELSASSYSAAAAQFGLPSYPSSLTFWLVSAPLTFAPPFSATLRAA